MDTLLNPTVIVEMLSSTTETYDRGRKFDLPAVGVAEGVRDRSQDEVKVERSSQGDEWVLTEFTSLDDRLPLESIGCQIAMREIYAGIEAKGQA